MPDSDRKEHKSHWHEGWLSVTFLFILIVTALTYPVLLAQGYGYDLSIVMTLLIFIVLSVLVIVLFAGLKTDQELRKHGIYDRARKKAGRMRDRLKSRRERRKSRKARAKGGSKEG